MIRNIIFVLLFAYCPLLIGVYCVAEQCSTYGDVRLVGGSGQWEGNVQVCMNNTWGYVCDNSWSSTDARVVCGQLKLSSSTNYVVPVKGSRFGSGDGTVHLDNVRCPTSHYYKIVYCPHGNISCNPYKDIAGVICSVGGSCEEDSIRLTHGANTTYGRSEGRVEVCYKGQWGTVCPIPTWNGNNSKVICRQLGYNGSVMTFPNTTSFGDTQTPVAFKDVQCVGNESSVFQCSKVAGSRGCSQVGRVGVRCFSNDISPCTSGSIRLWSAYNNTPSNEGMVHICRNGKWNAVCDKFYPYTCYIGRIVCRSLGYTGAYTLRTNAGQYYGYYDSNEYFEYSCTSSFTNLNQCPYNFNSYYCGTYANSLGVICANTTNISSHEGIIARECTNGDVRLGNNPHHTNEGRVEYCYKGLWSPACSLSSDTAKLVCKKLGYKHSFNIYDVDIKPNINATTPSSVFSHLTCSPQHSDVSQCRVVVKQSSSGCYVVPDGVYYSCMKEYGLTCT